MLISGGTMCRGWSVFDLDIGFAPADWSQPLVDRALPRLITGLADRADHRTLMAWMLGRGSPPTLEPWG